MPPGIDPGSPRQLIPRPAGGSNCARGRPLARRRAGARPLRTGASRSGSALLDLHGGAGPSSCALSLAASSLPTPSLTALGAPSTRSLASLRPRPGDRAHLLDDVDLLVADAARMTSNSVCSSASSAGAAAPAGRRHRDRRRGRDAPLSSSILDSSAASRTVSAERSSTICCRFAMVRFSLGSRLRQLAARAPCSDADQPIRLGPRAPPAPGPAAPPGACSTARQARGAADSRPTSLARSSSSEGRSASALDLSALEQLLPSAPPMITSFSLRLA